VDENLDTGGLTPHYFYMKMKTLKNKGQAKETTAVLVAIATVAMFLYVVPLLLDKVDTSFEDEFYTSASASNSTLLSASGYHIVDLTSPSTAKDGTLTVTYASCTTDDNVSVGGLKVGSLDGTSPDTFTVSGTSLSTATNVSYILTANCNITKSQIDYYQGSNYAGVYEDTSDNAVTGTSLMTIVIILLAGGALIMAVSQWMRTS